MKITKEMALTRKMFFDTLPRALGSTAYTVDGDTVTLGDGVRAFEIIFAEQATFKLGGFSIPRADVTLTLTGYSDADGLAAIKRFERYYHRGGG